MPSPTLDRDVAEAIYRLVGEYETENVYQKCVMCDEEANSLPCPDRTLSGGEPTCHAPSEEAIPLPSFAETIRILPKIGEKKGWVPYHAAVLSKAQTEARGAWHATIKWTEVSVRHCADLYASAPTSEDGIKQVSAYLRKIL